MNIFKYFCNPKFDSELVESNKTTDKLPIIRSYLTPNRWSRPGKKRIGVRGIEIHWVANPGTSAKANRNYFESRKGGKRGFGSTHFIVDLDGDILQMIPEKEIAYSSGGKKYKEKAKLALGKKPYMNTISIECCHVDWDGKMTSSTITSLTSLCRLLCRRYNLTGWDLYLHYDITGKICHKWFVENPEHWKEFKIYVG